MRQGLLALLFFLLLLPVSAYSQQTSKSRTEEAKNKLESALNLYSSGEYEECKILLDSYIRDDESKEAYFPNNIMARIYSLKALISYAYRDEREDYKEEIRGLLLKSLEHNPYHEIGDPSEIPPFVLNTFSKVKEEYLSQFSRVSRRISLGILGALVIDPTVLNNPSLLQPGLFFSYNLSKTWSLGFDLRFPLTLPIWDSIRGQIGLIWYPSFRVEKISTAISTYYVFALDNLSTYTHSLSLGGQAEIIYRSGFGFGARAELLRVDLILGLSDAGDLPDYKSISLFKESFLRITFANTIIYLFYTF